MIFALYCVGEGRFVSLQGRNLPAEMEELAEALDHCVLDLCGMGGEGVHGTRTLHEFVACVRQGTSVAREKIERKLAELLRICTAVYAYCAALVLTWEALPGSNSYGFTIELPTLE